jgi:hypothetical protein
LYTFLILLMCATCNTHFMLNTCHKNVK